jgi:hypothetical protein
MITAAGSMYWCTKGNTTECPSFHPNVVPDVWYYKNNTYAETKVWGWKNTEYSQEQMDRISKLKAFL